MIIERSSAKQPGRGPQYLKFKITSVTWDYTNDHLRLIAHNVPDFGESKAHHDWTLCVSISELQSVMKSVASIVINGESLDLHESVSLNLTDILKMATVCSEYRDTPRES